MSELCPTEVKKVLSSGGAVHKNGEARFLFWPDPTRTGYFSQSAHFGASVAAPHGMTGTLEVEFCGDPSINLSE